MNQAPDNVPSDGDAPSLKDDGESVLRLEKALALLADSLIILDDLRLSGIANHVSLGYELGCEHLRSLRSFGS